MDQQQNAVAVSLIDYCNQLRSYHAESLTSDIEIKTKFVYWCDIKVKVKLANFTRYSLSYNISGEAECSMYEKDGCTHWEVYDKEDGVEIVFTSKSAKVSIEHKHSDPGSYNLIVRKMINLGNPGFPLTFTLHNPETVERLRLAAEKAWTFAQQKK